MRAQLTQSRSSVVEKVLLRAHEEGKKISVIVVDSRPMLEGLFCISMQFDLTIDVPLGKKLLQTLTNAGIPCTYLLLPALPAAITEVSTVLVGAHALHANGAVFSRAGTALVALLAKQHRVPVVVCCETYKFAEGVQLDGFTKNELGAHSCYGFVTLLEFKHSLQRLRPLFLRFPSIARRRVARLVWRY